MAKKQKRSKQAKSKDETKLTASNADRYTLYQDTVQNPEFEIELATQVFRRRSGRKAMSLREDFCGTALLCARWVESHRDRVATGIDLDSEVLEWGRKHNIEPLGADAKRIRILQQDVRDTDGGRHDVVMALNYSYFVFKTRELLRSYFERVREALVEDGLLFIDLFGGWEAQQVIQEERRYKKFWYTWDQAAYNPITADFLAHIHFRFKDKSELDRAFTYDWRLWTIPELTELLTEAGYHDIEVLWEGEDEAGEGTGEFSPRKVASNDPGFNAYIVAGRKRALLSVDR